MNHSYYKPLLFFFLLFSTSACLAQSVIRQQPCVNESYKPQIDSLKQLFASQGYALIREASMTMESEYEMPVVMPLTQGEWYQFVFIGEPTSKLYEVRMYDWNERQVFYKKNQWGDVDGNIINYAYSPQFSEYHMIKPVQVNKQKRKGLCGYVMMFRKTK
jgi:hypothetical protein